MNHGSSPPAPSSSDLPHSVAGDIRRRRYWILVGSLFILIAGQIPLADPGSDGGLGGLLRAAAILVSFLLVFCALLRTPVVRPYKWLAILWPIIPMLTYCYVSTVWSLDPVATLSRSLETTALLILTVFWALLATTYTYETSKIAGVISTAIIAVVVYGMVVNIIISGTPLRLVVNREESLRLRLVLGHLHPLAVGDILAIGLMALCASRLRSLVLFGVGPVLFWLLVLTDATGARFLTVMICTALLVFHPKHKRQWAHRGALAVLLLAFAVVSGLLLEVQSLERFNDQRLWTLTGRISLWTHILNAGLAESWLGTGYDAARPAIQQVFGTAYQVHNLYLSIPVELGYVGMPLFIIFFVPWLLRVFVYGDPIALSFGTYILLIGMSNAGTFSKGHLAFAMMLPYCLAIMMPRPQFLSTTVREGELPPHVQGKQELPQTG